MNNALMVIAPYRHSGTWVFDDPAVGLVKEPFVAGIPEILDKMVKDIPDAHFGFRLIFAACPFPGATKFLRVNASHEESMGGTWYHVPALGNMSGWLCPALIKYIAKAPDALYAKAERRAA